MPQQYPFTAVLGCSPDALDPMGLSLILTTISPEIGGVLIRGQKGTAKSTAVRAVAQVLPPIRVFEGDRFSVDPGDPQATSPDGPFGADAPTRERPVQLVELPVGASEDRVVGSLNLQSALAEGQVTFEPGLLAKAHRGILYVDEVNLLPDHLVDMLLDAAAMGRSTVERDGISVEHAARFVLIGTMNPEEGELRPQMLDRFGLTVEVAAPTDPGLRAMVVRRRMAFDADPSAFVTEYAHHEDSLRERIAAARQQVRRVTLLDAALHTIAKVCAAFEVDGLRADIVTARTAIAHAAWCGRDEVTRDDIRAAALLALPHRRRRNPFDAPGLDEDLLDRILGDEEPPPGGDGGDGGPDGDDGADDHDGPDESTSEATEGGGDTGGARQENHASTGGDSASDQPRSDAHQPTQGNRDPGQEPDAPSPTDSPAGPLAVQHASAAEAAAARPRLLSVPGLGVGASGRRSRAITSDGRRVGARTSESGPGSLHVLETLRAAAAAQPQRRANRVIGDEQGRHTVVEFRPDDLRLAVREGKEANLVLFCVDASGSVAARKRMAVVKTAILSLLLDAYRRRDKVGLVTFRGEGAEVALPPTHSVEAAAARLDEVPSGGRTPLAEGLIEAGRVLTRERLRDPRLRPLLVVVTDGRATFGPAPRERAAQAASYLGAAGVRSVVIDVESGPMRLGLAVRLAAHLGAEHLPLERVTASGLTETVRSRIHSADLSRPATA